MKEQEVIYSMGLHEKKMIEIKTTDNQGNSSICNHWVIRVPSGWIYFIEGERIFVPFDNRFIKL